MRAREGDWLVVQTRTDDQHQRRGVIVHVAARDGRPPYTVRWLDDGRETVVFPGPDAVVVTAAHQRELDEAELRRIESVQLGIEGSAPDTHA